MTHSSDLSQTLISDIDRVLKKTKGFSPIGLCTRFALQRRLLERVRNYLVMQQGSVLPKQEEILSTLDQPSCRETLNSDKLASGDRTVPTQDAVAKTPPPSTPQSSASKRLPPPPPPLRSQPPKELEILRASLFQTLQREVDTLIARRDGLLQEIQQLETQKHQQLGDSAVPVSWESADMERLQLLRARTDQLLTSMDTSLHLAFNSLDKNLKSYHDSLAQSIDRMHSLGNQSEVLFNSMVNQLAEQWGRTASAYLEPSDQPPLSLSNLATSKQQPQPVSDSATPKKSSAPKKLLPTEILPFAGMELQSSENPQVTIAASDSPDPLHPLYTATLLNPPKATPPEETTGNSGLSHPALSEQSSAADPHLLKQPQGTELDQIGTLSDLFT
ncbi:MAG: hypothetical protein VKJ24_10460, partial [Synechococcales bacterium]|nr:hypothetical protein [Synechococcales bacterium]